MLEKEIAESCSEDPATQRGQDTSSKGIDDSDGRALSDDQLEAVSGGINCRKAGKDQQEFLTDGSIIAI